MKEKNRDDSEDTIYIATEVNCCHTLRNQGLYFGGRVWATSYGAQGAYVVLKSKGS